MKTVILVSGSPASGKSKLALWLSEQLGVQLLSKDMIKEKLFDSVGLDRAKSSIELGKLSFAMLIEQCRSQIATSQDAVLESAFRTSDGPMLAELFSSYTIVHAHCVANREVIVDRFKRRSMSEERHAGHVDATNIERLSGLLDDEEFELIIPGTHRIDVPTTSFSSSLYTDARERILSEAGNSLMCHETQSMLSDSVITLVKPRLDLAEEVREALIESYEDHIKFLLWPEPDPSLETVRSNIQQAIDNFDNDLNEYRFLILRNNDSRLIGTISLLIRNLKIPYFEFGYWVRSSEQGRGYITAAVKLLEDYAVNTLKVRRLEIRMAESNIASIRVAERAGYAFEAKLHSDGVLSDGTIRNSLIYYKLYS